MSVVDAKGLDGTNPVGFLAALGVVKLLERSGHAPELAWQRRGGAVFATFGAANATLNAEWLAEHLATLLRVLSSESEYGMAHIGEKISVSPEHFRRHAERAVNRWCHGRRTDSVVTDDPELTADALSAFGSDQVRDRSGSVAYSPLSFSNGSSGQLLLKDFRAAASLCSKEQLKGTLVGTPTLHEITSLNWDPGDQRAAAHRWRDPATEKALVDPGVNALAFVGMSWFTVAPDTKLRAVAWRDSRPRGLMWPLWERMIGPGAIQALLSHVLGDSAGGSYGGSEVRFSRVVNPDGKRNYFAPSRREG